MSARPVCVSRKASYRTQAAADRALNAIHMEARGYAIPTTLPVRSYECGCGAWHLTSQPLRNVAPRKRRRRRPRHLTVAAPVAPEPVAVDVSYEPTDPISEARREMWRRLQAENAARNLQNPYPWRRAA